ncbi:hypothetical protein V6N11_021676 [Hibiscus sabdariffa]|uniref:Uncharacterized protein n=1 Tax=Hibiscus sabdariffa TaxID=183260 RepID=A0ABR2TGX1_9ROSI
MLVCSCAARLAGGGWDSGVFGAAVWQPHGGFRQFCWLHRDGLVQFRWQNRGGPVQSRWQHHGDPMQFRWQHRGGPVQFRWQHRLARMPPGMLFQSLLSRGKSRLCAPLALFFAFIGAWLWPPLGRCPPLQHSCATCSPRSDVGLPCALLAWPAEWACSSDVVGITGAGMMVWCASSGTPMPLLATMFVTADDLEATEVADPADPVLDPPGLASETSAQPDPAGPEVRADPNAEVRVNPSVAPTATAPAAPEVRTDPTSAVRMNPTVAPMVQPGPMAPAVAASVVRTGPAVPATAAPMVRKGQAVPATAAPMVRKGQTVPATAATALRTDLPVPNIVAPVVRTPQRAADSPPAPLVPLETDAMVEDVGDEDSSGQNLVADGSLPDDAPYDPLVHAETSAMLEEALEISRDCVLLADMDGVLQADGEDLVNAATHEAADSIIREVAAKILGADAPSDGSDPPIALAKMGPSPSASPPKSGLSKSAPAGLRRAAMPVVPEHQEFDEWCAARSRTPPANVAVHPSEARASSIPPPRPHKRLAPSSDPSRAKRSRASASSSSRIPSSTKAGMSSVNNSPAETARQSRREK